MDLFSEHDSLACGSSGGSTRRARSRSALRAARSIHAVQMGDRALTGLCTWRCATLPPWGSSVHRSQVKPYQQRTDYLPHSRHAEALMAKAKQPRTRRARTAPGSARTASRRISSDLNAVDSRSIASATLPHPPTWYRHGWLGCSHTMLSQVYRMASVSSKNSKALTE